MSEDRHKLLGNKAPENPWDEMILLREMIWRLRAERDNLARLLKIAATDRYTEEIKEALQGTGYELN